MGGMKTCSGCGSNLPVDAFDWKDRAAGRRGARCQECRRSYQREWYRKHSVGHRERNRRRRAALHGRNSEIILHAKDRPCVDCGNRYETELMDFDHVQGEKRFDIGSSRHTRSSDEIRLEITKCEVVCAVCHRLRTTRRARNEGL